jgi:hypothetical protein
LDMHASQRLLLAALLLCPALPVEAAEISCRPCAGLRVDPSAGAAAASDIARTLKDSAHLEAGSPLFVAWEAPLDSSPEAANPGNAADVATALRESGATPWISLVFRTPPPLAQNSERLQLELRAAAELAGKAPAGTWFQVVWRPEGAETQAFGAATAAEYAFLLKRAAVALTGARQNVLVASQALPADAAVLHAFYGQEVAAYLEAVVLQPAAPQALAAAVAAVQEADPGRPVVVDALPLPAVPAEALAGAAREAAQGINLTLFQAPVLGNTTIVPALAPFALLAREFKGDLSYDPSSSPSGAAEAWSFVRGKDLSMRVIALAPEGARGLTLRFSDPQLRRPVRFPIGGERVPPPSGKVAGQELQLQVDSPGRVAVLGLDRPTAAELHGIAEKVTVSGQREIPVEEILRRLQAFEDAQSRRLDHYSAIDTTALRFQPTAGAQTFEATLQGPLFFSPKTGTDWAWQTLYVNGVKWRSKQLPEIPLIQPEKAAALPLEIHFTKEYRYRLRGNDTIDGRDAWVVDFAPSGPGAAGRLYQGSVWVDQKTYARLRTRAVQIGLEGEVLSNEETMLYSPIDEAGNPAPWSSESFVLPLHLVSQQILSVVNATTVVERDVRLTNVRINAPGFEEQRQQVESSDVTMVRDTDKGLRYLVKDENGERVVKEGFNHSKVFLAGGVFYDDSLAYPLPLAGLNYLSFDFKGTGKQLNVFFGGALLLGSIAEPRLNGSRFDVGADVFAIAVPFTDTVSRNGKGDTSQDVKQLPASVGFKIGHPIGDFVKVRAEYDLMYFGYKKTSDTEKGFVIPSDNLTHSLEVGSSYSRSGYGLSAAASYNRRSKWDFWGPAGNTDFSPDQKDFYRWEARASKNWYLPKFQKAGLEFDYAGGSDLDRFSKYEFGFFGGTRVHGYKSDSVRATQVYAGHASYGFVIGDVFNLQGIADAALATDKQNGLENKLLGGVGLQGTFVGPWQTVVNLDAGKAVAGPDHGFVLYLVFLKLFR